jgi:hypothetical protein
VNQNPVFKMQSGILADVKRVAASWSTFFVEAHGIHFLRASAARRFAHSVPSPDAVGGVQRLVNCQSKF